MIRISLPYIYSLAETIEPLSDIPVGEPFQNVFFVLWKAQTAVETLIENSVFSSSLRSCRSHAMELIRVLKEQTDNMNFERKMEPPIIATLQFAHREFKTSLLAETGVFPSYFVTQKEPFDTLILLDKGYGLFPSELIAKVPESQFDASEAGKSLAFELATACGFHLFRVVESVLRRYYAHVTSGNPPPKVRTIGTYVRKIRQLNCGDEIILSALEQLANLHRNPLIHPEVALSTDEAISLMGIARSAVTAMLAVLPTLPLTTSSATFVAATEPK